MRYNLLLVLLFISCTKEVEVELPEFTPSLVVSSLFTSDSILKISLNKTQPIFDNRATNITNASIFLFEDEIIIDTFFLDETVYRSKIFPKPNKDYSFKINTPEFKNVYGNDLLPNKPVLTTLFFKDSITRGIEGELVSQAKIKINDDILENNYYELEMLAYLINPITREHYLYEIFYDTNNDFVLENEGLLSLYPRFLVFSDELFNGSVYELKINYNTPTFFLENEIKPIDYKLIVKLRAVSKNYYEYRKRIIIHVDNQYSDIWDGVGEPVNMFTNIKNGYGIFAGYNQVIDTIYKN